MTTPNFTRRKIIKGMAASSLIPLLGANLIGCSDSDSNSAGDPASSTAESGTFNHGIASGDPLTDRVILWTRLTPASAADTRLALTWEVATDPTFDTIVQQGAGETSVDVDFTAKVDVPNLLPGTRYYYRFSSGANRSATGNTRTLPTGAVAAATFAVVSCSNYPAGFFNVYREVAKQEVDAVLHLGDYLYEYDSAGYASSEAVAFGRVVDPATELISIDDYRRRYAQYRGDEDLQIAHAAHPFILVWDDHEVANDAWREGAENHQPDSEGDYTARKQAAIQAWYEWLPVRPPADDQEIIYRRFQYGDLVDLFMLDTRIVGRDQQVAYSDYTSGERIDVDSARAALGDSNRTMLGAAQRQWLKAQLADSISRWQVLGQQVLMGRYTLPSPIIEALDPNNLDDAAIAAGTAAVLSAAAVKAKAPAERTAEEQALLDSAIPYNTDAWDGYAFERNDLLEYARQLNSKLVVFAGDTHNAWATQLTTDTGATAGVEFATASVTSPGLDVALGAGTATAFVPFITSLVDDLVYADLLNRGYLLAHFTADNVTARWRYVSAVDSPDYAPLDSASKEISVSRESLQVRA